MGILPAWFVFVAAGIRLSSGATYTMAALKGRAKPNPITWLFWALTPMIVFIAQVVGHAGWSAVMSFAFALSPLIVFIISLKKNWSRAHFTPSTIACAILATIGVVLWQLTNNPVMAIIFSIMADTFASIPTLIKCYYTPHSEYPLSYFLSMVSVLVTLAATSSWSFTSSAFAVYMFCINFLLFSFIVFSPVAHARPQTRRKRA